MKHLISLLAIAFTLSAQTPAAFEVASIKPTNSKDAKSTSRLTPGRITMENVSLKKVTLMAYGIPDDRDYALVGPDWLATERFDIQATFPSNTATPQVLRMMQTLLADRFKLTLHPETRQLPMYALTVGKNGPKIHPDVENGQTQTSGAPGRLEATRISMQKLADLLAAMLGQQVVDETGLKGVFSFTLEWSPDESQKASGPVTAQATGPSLFTALQEQLGLKLEGRKGPVEILVVDHIEKTPGGN